MRHPACRVTNPVMGDNCASLFIPSYISLRSLLFHNNWWTRTIVSVPMPVLSVCLLQFSVLLLNRHLEFKGRVQSEYRQCPDYTRVYRYDQSCRWRLNTDIVPNIRVYIDMTNPVDGALGKATNYYWGSYFASSLTCYNAFMHIFWCTPT